MRMLILGGTRFIGPFVVRELVALGHDVSVFHRGESESEIPPGVQHVHGNRQDITTFRAEFARQSPDAVIDMSAYSEREATSAVETFSNIVRRYIVISSIDVYRSYGLFHGSESGPPRLMPLTEDSPLRGKLFPYRSERPGLDDYEKILVERAVMAAPELRPTVLRLPMVYGEGDYQRRLRIEIKRMDANRPAILLEETLAAWRSTYGHVANVAHAIVHAATDDRAAGRIYNVGEQDAPSYKDWLRQIGDAAGWEGEIIVLPRERLPAALLPPPGHYKHHLAADSSRIREELGYRERVSRSEGLRRAIEWERGVRRKTPSKPFDYSVEDELLATLGTES